MDLENNGVFLFLSDVLIVDRVVFEFFDFVGDVFVVEDIFFVLEEFVF